jgi:hypothetical protein
MGEAAVAATVMGQGDAEGGEQGVVDGFTLVMSMPVKI